MVNGDQRYGYLPCPLHDTGKAFLIIHFNFIIKIKLFTLNN